MSKFIAWLKAIFTRTKEKNVPNENVAAAATDVAPATAPAVASPAIAVPTDVTAAVTDSGAVAVDAASVYTGSVISDAAAPVAAVADAGATVVEASKTVGAVTLAETVEQRVVAVLSSLKNVLTFADVEVDNIWEESIALAKKLA